MMSNFTVEAVAAMWLYGNDYAATNLSASEFYGQLDDSRRKTVRHFINDLGYAPKCADAVRKAEQEQFKRDCVAVCQWCADEGEPIPRVRRGLIVLSHLVDSEQDLWEKCQATAIHMQEQQRAALRQEQRAAERSTP